MESHVLAQGHLMGAYRRKQAPIRSDTSPGSMSTPRLASITSGYIRSGLIRKASFSFMKKRSFRDYDSFRRLKSSYRGRRGARF
jgi:hypothetical protein